MSQEAVPSPEPTSSPVSWAAQARPQGRCPWALAPRPPLTGARGKHPQTQMSVL